MRDLIHDVFVGAFANPELAKLEDQARVPVSELFAYGNRLAFTTDSYVVHPLFFPGGGIGSLAVNGTVNDPAVGPLPLDCGEEDCFQHPPPVETLLDASTHPDERIRWSYS